MSSSSSSSLSDASDREGSSEEEVQPLHQLLTSMPQRFIPRTPRSYGRYIRRQISRIPYGEVDEPDEDGNTPLMIALITSNPNFRYGYNHWFFAFTSHLGFDVNQKNKKGLTPLLIAVDNLNFSAIHYLLEFSNADSCVKYPDGEWLLSRLMNRYLSNKNCDLITYPYRRFNYTIQLMDIFEQLYNLSAFEIFEQSSVDSSPVVDLLCTCGLVEQILEELACDAYHIKSIHDLNLILFIVSSFGDGVSLSQVSDEFRTHLARYLLSIVLKPNHEEQFLLSMVSRSKTLVEVFVKTGAMPVFNNISKTTISNLFYSGHVDQKLESLNTDCFSAVSLSFCLLDVDLANTFINSNFLINLDLHPSTLMKSKIQEITENHREVREIYNDFYCQPHSLFRLCFVQVSMCVGFGSDRKERVSLTGLCHHLQTSLMFG